MAITDKGKKVILRGIMLIALVAGVVGLRQAAKKGYGRDYLPAFMLPKVSLNDKDAPSLAGSAKTFYGLPSSTVADLPGAPEVRINFWAWNSQMGCLYSNGGETTTKGSLMEKQGLKVTIKRQDDNSILMAELTNLAKAMHDGNNDPTDGVHFIGIMGDGSPSFLRQLNNQLIEAYGPDYRAEIVGSCGYSRGEDAVWGPEEWKTDKESLRGSVIATVLRDGDWNIAVRYAADNGIPVNADETTYDPTAMNFVNAKDYVDAGAKYIQGYCETRKLSQNGKLTGQTKNICVQGVSSWTPVDVTVAKEKGGIIRVVSTKEYANQMPHVIIGIRKWNKQHRETVEKLLTAFTEGGDQVLTFPKALDRASEISQEINQEKDADAGYWKRYYLGSREKDATGQIVELGGSKANNLADNVLLFGLATGSNVKSSRFAATYNVFGGIAAKMYPKLVSAPMPLDSVLDVSYLRAVMNSTNDVGTAEEVTYKTTDSLTEVVGRRGVAIEFATGSASLTPEGEAQLENLFRDLQINSLNVIVNGHTDNAGNPISNQDLSERRALTVKTWLQRRSPNDFPAGRISTHGYGDTQPVASNGSITGRSKNRRVEIIIGR